MSKLIILTAILLSLTLNTATTSNSLLQTESLVIDETPEPVQPTGEPAETITEEGFVYMNVESDFFTYIETSGWFYENYSNMAVFYNNNSMSLSSSIAVSSFTNPVDEADRKNQTALYIDVAVDNLKSIVENIELSDVEEIQVDEYTFYKYQYTATLISGGTETSGEYLYWWIDDREYTCSMFCFNEDFDLFSSAMKDIRNNFMQPSSMDS